MAPEQGEHCLLEALLRACDLYRSLPAVVRGPEVWTYERLGVEVLAAREWMDRDFGTGTCMVVPRNTPQSVAVVLGGVSSSAVPVFADPAWTPTELCEIGASCGANTALIDGPPPNGLDGVVGAGPCGTTVVHFDREPGRQEQSSDRDSPVPGETAFGRFTSGTTGRSRCLTFSAVAALNAAQGWREAAALTADDLVLCLATLNNGLAFNASLLCVFLAGGCLAFHPGPIVRSSLLRALESLRPSVLVAFPFAFEQLTGTRAPMLQELRLAVSSAAPIPSSTTSAWRSAGRPICDYYGLVELGPCTFNDGSRPGSVGYVLPHVSCRITDEEGRDLETGKVGRIRLRSPSMAQGYLDQGPTFADRLDEQGFYVTQDLGLVGSDGHLELHGRVGRVLNLGGRKVNPGEVEDVIRAMAGVTGVVVRMEESAGRPVLAAYIESRTLQRADVVSRCAGRLATYKIPQLITVVAALPRSSTGKVSMARLPVGTFPPISSHQAALSTEGSSY